MPDDRQQLLNEAADKLKEAGAETISIIAQWPDKEIKTAILVVEGKNRDPWANNRAPVKRALGRGLKEIRKDRHSDEKLDRIIGVVRKA